MAVLNEIDRAEALASSSPDEAMELLYALVRRDVDSGEEAVKMKEQAILKLGDLLAKHKRADGEQSSLFVKIVSDVELSSVLRSLCRPGRPYTIYQTFPVSGFEG